MSERSFKVEGLKEVTFMDGDTVMAEGTQSNRVYLLKTGSVKITREGKEICKISEPLSIFGEIGALLECPHTATVTASVESEFYVIEDLRAYCQDNPGAAVFVSEILAQRLVNMNEHFTEFKKELDSMSSLDDELKFAKKISSLILRMDRFWGKEVFESKPRQK